MYTKWFPRLPWLLGDLLSLRCWRFRYFLRRYAFFYKNVQLYLKIQKIKLLYKHRTFQNEIFVNTYIIPSVSVGCSAGLYPLPSLLLEISAFCNKKIKNTSSHEKYQKHIYKHWFCTAKSMFCGCFFDFYMLLRSRRR